MARKLSVPMIEALSHIVRYGQWSGAVKTNTVAAIGRHGYASSYSYRMAQATSAGWSVLPTQLTPIGWAALPADVRVALLGEMHETAIAQRAMEHELLHTPVVPVSEEDYNAVLAARVNAAYRALVEANSAMPHVRANSEHADRALGQALYAFTGNDLVYTEALRSAFLDSGESLAWYTSQWTRDELIELMRPYMPSTTVHAYSTPAEAGCTYPKAHRPHPGARGHACNGEAALPDPRRYWGERMTTDLEAREEDHAMAHRSFGPWIGFHAARLGILDAIESERAKWRSSGYDSDNSSQLRCVALAAQFAVDENATQATVDGLRYRIWTNDNAPDARRILPDVDLWDGKAQTAEFMAEIRNASR